MRRQPVIYGANLSLSGDVEAYLLLFTGHHGFQIPFQTVKPLLQEEGCGRREEIERERLNWRWGEPALYLGLTTSMQLFVYCVDVVLLALSALLPESGFVACCLQLLGQNRLALSIEPDLCL